MLSRRGFMKLGALACALTRFDIGQAWAALSPTESIVACGDSLLAPPLPFQAPLPIPPVLMPYMSKGSVDYYTLRTLSAFTQVVPDRKTQVWGYAGNVPGPTIKAKVGRTAVIAYTNNLPAPISTHVHGMMTSDNDDGHPQDLMSAFMGTKSNTYPNGQPGATLWYHDHRMGYTAKQVYAGLAGMYLLEDTPLEASLNLPAGPYDLPLMLVDKTLNDDGMFTASLCHDSPAPGMAEPGRMILVNGRYAPYLVVEPRQYRLRLLNAANISWFHMFLRNADISRPVPAITVIASDLGLLPAPVAAKITDGVQQLRLAGSERAEVVIDFSAFAGQRIHLLNVGGRTSGVNPQDSLHMLEFRVKSGHAVTPIPLPATLRPFTRLETQVDVATIPHRTVVLDNINGTWLMNGEGFGRAAPGADFHLGKPHTGFDNIRAGSVEKWTLTSRFGKHPIHIHVCRFQIMRRSINGVTIDPADWMNPWERDSWKDSVAVGPNETVELLVEFGTRPGLFVFHCHNLEHEDTDMMANMRIVP